MGVPTRELKDFKFVGNLKLPNFIGQIIFVARSEGTLFGSVIIIIIIDG